MSAAVGDESVGIVDDDAALRRSLERTVSSAGWVPTVYSSGEQFLALGLDRPLACTVLDVRMHAVSGLTVLDEMRARELDCPVVFISAFADVPAAVEAMRRGAIDFLQKPFSEFQLLRAIEAAAAAGRRRREALTDRLAACEHLERLSARQREVLDLLMRGLVNKQVADALGTSERTIEAHRKACMEKLEADSFVDLVRTYLVGSVADVPRRGSDGASGMAS